MVTLLQAFSYIKTKKIAVVGDLMLDTYTIGKTNRISPEAPVPVLRVEREEHRPGGAGNVVCNLRALRCDVVMIGRIGDDETGALLRNVLAEEGSLVEGVVEQKGWCTPVKNRVIAEYQQIVRIDQENVEPLPEQLEQHVIELLPELLTDVDVIAVSDYGKGMVTEALMGAIVQEANKRQIPVIVDPKGLDYRRYSGVEIIKPNLLELYQAANCPVDSSIDDAAKCVFKNVQAEYLLVTRSSKGMTLIDKYGKRDDFPISAREVIDVTGAGDTALAMLAVARANALRIEDSIVLANIAAGVAVERLGCAKVTRSDVARRLLSDDAAGKVFDEMHLYVLREALAGRRFVVVSLSESEGISTSLITGIHALAQREHWDLLVHLNDVEPSAPFISALASLHAVDYIVVKSGDLRHLCTMIQPEEVYTIEQGEHLRQEL